MHIGSIHDPQRDAKARKQSHEHKPQFTLTLAPPHKEEVSQAVRRKRTTTKAPHTRHRGTLPRRSWLPPSSFQLTLSKTYLRPYITSKMTPWAYFWAKFVLSKSLSDSPRRLLGARRWHSNLRLAHHAAACAPWPAAAHALDSLDGIMTSCSANMMTMSVCCNSYWRN